MSLAGIKLRSLVAQTLRDLLRDQGFEEYLPQLMSGAQPLEPTIYPFMTKGYKQSSYFATSPEGYLKQVMASGGNNCFAISHAFRNLEGEGPLHRPEFLIAEWYQQDADWLEIMRQTQAFVMAVWQKCDPKSTISSNQPWQTVSYRDLWQHHEHVDLTTLLTEDSMTTFAKAKGYQVEGASWEQLFHQVVFNDIEPHFSEQPFFLIDFPARISPLAKPQSASPQFAERFELIINRVECANGNTENTDVRTIKTMMEQEQQLRQNKEEFPPIDEAFLTSLSKLQGHQWAGVGLGIDRLTMLIGGITSIRDIQWI